MRADPRFADQPLSFWAYVRTITEALGSAVRGADAVSSFTVAQMASGLSKLGRSDRPLGTASAPSDLARMLVDYFEYRAELLNSHARVDLMIATEAAAEFDAVALRVGASEAAEIVKDGKVIARDYRLKHTTVRVPMNKQTGEKRAPAFLTGIVNLTVAFELQGHSFEEDPRRVPVIDHKGELYAALSRRMDGAYPSSVNPIALWEIKEYYYTTTFGSKISDAVYITALDGYERRELEEVVETRIQHLVMADAFGTWWGMGKSYLCRFVDLVNRGYVHEVLLGREVSRELPAIVRTWLKEEQPVPRDEP